MRRPVRGRACPFAMHAQECVGSPPPPVRILTPAMALCGLTGCWLPVAGGVALSQGPVLQRRTCVPLFLLPHPSLALTFTFALSLSCPLLRRSTITNPHLLAGQQFVRPSCQSLLSLSFTTHSRTKSANLPQILLHPPNYSS